MADGKKSFIAYSDWKEIFDALPNEDAGALIKHIFAYVNDENPVADSVLINAVFATIKATLKRDLKKWESEIEQRSKAGLRSAESRRTKINDRSTSVNESQRKSTVSVSDSVTVSENKYTLEFFEQQGYQFNLPKIGHDAINRFLEWREKHPTHGAIKSAQQIEAIIIGFRDKNYSAEQVVASVNKTIANGAKNLIMDEVGAKGSGQTNRPKPHPDLPDDWWTAKLTREQILLIPSSINAARIVAQNKAKGHNLGI